MAYNINTKEKNNIISLRLINSIIQFMFQSIRIKKKALTIKLIVCINKRYGIKIFLYKKKHQSTKVKLIYISQKAIKK